MNINWKELISNEYWFGIDRAGMHLTDKVVLYFGVAMVAIALIVLVVRLVSNDKLKRPVYNRLLSVLFTVGLLEMLWYVLRAQFVNALGTRFSAFIVGLFGLYFLYQPVKYLLFKYKKDANEMSRQQLKEKYLQQR